MTVGEGFRQVWCDNAPEFTAFQRRGHAEDCRGKRDIPGAAHRRWRAFYLRQLSAMAPLHLDDPCGICRQRGGPRAHLGKIAEWRYPGGRASLTMPSSMVSTPAAFMPLVEEGI